MEKTPIEEKRERCKRVRELLPDKIKTRVIKFSPEVEQRFRAEVKAHKAWVERGKVYKETCEQKFG